MDSRLLCPHAGFSNARKKSENVSFRRSNGSDSRTRASPEFDKGSASQDIRHHFQSQVELRKVLEVAGEKSGWGKRKPGGGWGLGIAAHRSFNTYVASVVEVQVDAQGTLRIPRVEQVVDAGTYINPDRVRSQMEGSAVMAAGLAAFAVTPWFPLALAFLAAAGFGYLTSNTAATSRLQLGVPEEERGRVMALWAVAFLGVRPLASIVDGAVAGAFGVRVATVVLALPALAGAVFAARTAR